MKKWNNFANYWPIMLKFGIQFPFTHLRVTVMFGNDPIIFSPTNPTYQKLPVAKFSNCHNLGISDRTSMKLAGYTLNEKATYIKSVLQVRPAKFASFRDSLENGIC